MENLIVTTYGKLLDIVSRQKITSVLLWIVAASYAEMFIKNGWIKFDPEGFWRQAFLDWGYPMWFMYFIGVVEVGAGILLLFPKVRPIGSLTLAVVMVGAVTTRIVYGFINGFAGAEEGFLTILYRLDAMFFISTIAMFLYFFSLGKKTIRR